MSITCCAVLRLFCKASFWSLLQGFVLVLEWRVQVLRARLSFFQSSGNRERENARQQGIAGFCLIGISCFGFILIGLDLPSDVVRYPSAQARGLKELFSCKPDASAAPWSSDQETFCGSGVQGPPLGREARPR